ncbi:MAG TPA: ABC-F family ATP-binding cassette domain-containing protein [Thermomicrobiales bacterium]|nr:ABC-F family ATP-binding cassette domain-containing protein [Thermomicrobiales bacterium]
MTIQNLTGQIDGRIIFENVSFSVNAGDVLGVIGPNGSGKSTLLAILTGERLPHFGSVSLAPGIRLGALRQGFADRPTGTLGDLVDVPANGLVGFQDAVSRTASALADPDSGDDAMAAYDAAIERFDGAGGYEASDRLAATMGRFQVDPMFLPAGWGTPLSTLSGGQKTRAGLAALIASAPDILVLDEPTNHLDLEAARTVEELVLTHRGATIVVSHDRAFLDRVANRILAMDDLDTDWELITGNYSDYLELKAAEAAEQASAWRRQQDMIDRVEQQIRSISERGQKVEGKTHVVTNRWKKYIRTAVVRERRLERMLESDERIEKPALRWGVAADLPAPPPGGNDVVIVEDLQVGFAGAPVLRGIDLHLRGGERVALLGPNGSGKTTLIRTICGDIVPDSGTVRIGSGIVIGRFSQEQETLDPTGTVVGHVRSAAAMDESDARSFLHKFLFGGDAALKRVTDLSYGERARLALALVILRGANFLVLDEPLNHLDLQSREEFEEALASFTGTSLMVLHDRRAIERLATRSVLLRNGRLQPA